MISYSQISTSGSIDWDFVVGHLEVPYFSISLSLNILITLMIAARLIRHSRNIRSAIGRTSDNGLYNTVVTMLVESCVLYAVGSLLFLGPLGAKSPIQGIFAPSFGNVQVRVRSFLEAQLSLIVVTNGRSSLRTSSFYESPTGPH